MEYSDYYLAHHGIKGMKWGVRRYENKDGTLTAAGKRRYDRDHPHEDYANAHSKKDVRNMSTRELQARNTRLQAEQQYAALTKKTSRGKKAVTAFIATAGTLTAVGLAVDQYKKFAKRDDVSKIMQGVGHLAVKVTPEKARAKAAAVGVAYQIATSKLRNGG